MVGINGRVGIVLIDAVDRSDEALSWSFEGGAKQTFAQMRNVVPKVVIMKIVQDDAANTLYSLALAANGTTKTGVYKPRGNAAASVSQPHYTFNVEPSGPTTATIIGGDAAEDATQALTVDVAWQITSWTKVTA